MACDPSLCGMAMASRPLPLLPGGCGGGGLLDPELWRRSDPHWRSAGARRSGIPLPPRPPPGRTPPAVREGAPPPPAERSGAEGERECGAGKEARTELRRHAQEGERREGAG